MKVMIVRIENCTNSQTEDLIKSFFESRNYEVIVKSFDISVAAEIPEVLLKNSLLLAPGENDHFEPIENNQLQPNKKSHCHNS